MLPIQALNAVCTGNHPAAIDSINLSPALRVLVLAPHPDDFDAIAITLRSLQQQGNEIHLAVLSGGSKGVQDSYLRSQPGWKQKAQLREQEQLNSCGYFGLCPSRIKFLRLPEAADGELAQDSSSEARVRDQINESSSDILFLPFGNDSNIGHQRTYDMTRRAVRDLGKPMLALYNRDAKTLSFRTDLYSGFNETQANWKRSLLRFHDTQQARNVATRGHGFDERILSFNRKLAQELALEDPYAETFQVELFHVDHLPLEREPTAR